MRSALPDSDAMVSTLAMPQSAEAAALEQFVACFEGLKDPRTGNAGLHDLHELLVIALCTVLSGGQGATHMAEFAVAKESFLRGFLKLENGLPSHDTFSRLFRLPDSEQFRAVFQRFMARFAETVQGVVAIDGKVLRHSFDKASGKSALHMVSSWGIALSVATFCGSPGRGIIGARFMLCGAEVVQGEAFKGRQFTAEVILWSVRCI